MNNRFITTAFALLITTAWGVGASADQIATQESAKVTSESSSSTQTSGKQAADSTSSSDKNTKSYEVKVEAEKRARVESRSHRGHYRNGYYYAPSELASGISGPGMSFGGGVGTHNAGVIFSPANGDRKAAMGVQWMSPKGIGLMLWGSGDLNGPDDLIDATIPHSDFSLESTSGSYAIEALFALSQQNPTITLGAGVCTTKTWNYAVSNATGWKWDEGTETKQKFAGSIGCRFRVSDRMSVQYAYDTVQHNFFGLTMDF